MFTRDRWELARHRRLNDLRLQLDAVEKQLNGLEHIAEELQSIIDEVEAQTYEDAKAEDDWSRAKVIRNGEKEC